MELNTEALERIHEAMRGPARRLAEIVQPLCGANLAALAFYGPVVGAGFDPALHRARSVLVFHRDDLDLVHHLAREGLRLGKAGLAAPLIMTPAYIRASLDVFPLEFLDICQQHATLLGDDPFVGLTFEDAHVRLQCEREFKTILIGMRQGLLATAGREKMLGDVAADAIEELIRVFRGLLWLKEHKQVGPQDEVLAEVEAAIARPLPGIRRAQTGAPVRDWADFRQLYKEILHLGDVVDAL